MTTPLPPLASTLLLPLPLRWRCLAAAAARSALYLLASPPPYFFSMSFFKSVLMASPTAGLLPSPQAIPRKDGAR